MNRDPLTPVTEAQVAAYARDGVVCLRGVFDQDWIALVRQGIERNFNDPGAHAHYYDRDDEGHVFLNDVVSWRRIAEYARFLVESPAGQIAAHLMGSHTARVFYDSAFYRTAGTSAKTPWHQDMPYWCVEGAHVASLWLPVDPVPRESALEFVRGSHLWKKVFYRRSFFAEGKGTHAFEPARDVRGGREEAREAPPDLDAERASHDIAAWAMEPGDCLVFCAMVYHGHPGNRSKAAPLRVLAARYTGDDARYAIKPEGADPDLKAAGLAHGERFHGDWFPRVWPREPAAA